MAKMTKVESGGGRKYKRGDERRDGKDYGVVDPHTPTPTQPDSPPILLYSGFITNRTIT